MLLVYLSFFATLLYSQSTTFQWAKSFGGNLDDWGRYITTDNLGNVYTIGWFDGIVDFDPGVGVNTLTSGGAKDVFISKTNSNGDFIWAKSIGGNGIDVGYSIAVDAFGNVYSIGAFSSIVDFNPGIGTYTLSSIGLNDVFILKLDIAGNFVWAKTMGGNGDDSASGLAIDTLGNICLVGSFQGIADFDPNAGINNLTSSGGMDIFISKYDSVGNLIWVKNMGGSLMDYGYAIDLDKNGNVYTSGYFSGTADFDPGVSISTQTSMGSGDVFISKLDQAGNFVWAKSFGGTSIDVCNSVCTDFSGNIYLTGGFENTVDFDPSVASTTLTVNGLKDIFISKFDSSGNFLWVKRMGGTGSDYAYSIVTDTTQNVLISGVFANTVDFDPGTGVYNLTSNGSNDAVVLKVNNLGNLIWAISFGGSGNEYGTSLIVNKFNNVFACGSFNSTVDFDPNLSIFNLTSNGNGDVFIQKMVQCYAPLTLSIVGTNSLCLNSSANLVASGATSYTWNTGAILSSVILTPTVTSTYVVSGSNDFGCIGSQAVTVTVNNSCADVWPGDANSDGLADNLDVLELGLHFTQTGVSRASVSSTWQSCFANNWTGTITNGKNLNHSDCNGDGIINDDDTLAIYNNYGLIHAFKTAQTTTVNPQLSIVPDQSFVVKGTWGTASIYLGDATNSINNINGLAYTMDFDKNLIETNNIYIEYQNSFFDAGQNLDFKKLDFATGKIYAASTHTLNNNVSGFGKIAILHYQIKSTLSSAQVLNFGITQAVQSDASGTISPLTSGSGSLTATIDVGLLEEILNDNAISVNPNPTNGSLTTNSKTELQKIEIVSITGQVLLSENPMNVSHTLYLESLSNGIYFVNVYQNDLVVKREKIVLNK